MSDEATVPDLMPVQMPLGPRREQAVVKKEVALRAYEVYCHVHGPQERLVTGGCRGGFGVGELIAFLYARSFSKEEWCMRVDEAFDKMRLGR